MTGFSVRKVASMRRLILPFLVAVAFALGTLGCSKDDTSSPRATDAPPPKDIKPRPPVMGDSGGANKDKKANTKKNKDKSTASQSTE
jgi:hypothetical protein